MKTFLVGIAAMAFLGGCATPYSGQTVKDEGEAPTLEQAERAVLEYLYYSLKDRDSLRDFRIKSGPRVVSWARPLLAGGGNERAWLVCAEYNAKNSYGGYVGIQTEAFALRMGNQKAYVMQDVNWAISDARC